MNKTDAERNTDFAIWIADKLRERDMSQAEFANQVGVRQGTVSKWLRGTKPQGRFLDLIAAAFHVTYDDVATRLGDRPPNFVVDPNSPEGQLVPLIRKVTWTPEFLDIVKSVLEGMIKQSPSYMDEEGNG